jgi:putative membrane protein insertion efficiency factor
LLVVLCVVLLPLLADLRRPPSDQLSVPVLLAAIDLYQHFLSAPLASSGARCRFEPSCSRYAEAVIHDHGALLGTGLALRRILRCGPWTPAGTTDRPPARLPP